MHISDSRLALAHRPIPWMIGIGLLCTILCISLLKALLEVAIGGILISAFMLVTLGWIALTRIFVRLTLLADRDSDRLRLSRQTLGGISHQDYPLRSLRGAETEIRYSEHSSAAQPGLVLCLDDTQTTTRLRLPLFRPDPADLLQASETINTWLKAPPSNAHPAEPSAATPS